MTMESCRTMLGWCTLINMGILLYWFLIFTLARDWIYRFHGRWFKLSPERFDAIHYSGMAFFKIGIFLLNLGPYLALRLAG
ncbi:MAG: DUF6868 family protein [Thermodesulfobacteriota bacterium]